MGDTFREFMAEAKKENLNPMELNDNEMLEAVDEANIKAIQLMKQLESPAGQEDVSDITLNLEAIKTNLEQYGAQLINSGKTESPMYDRIVKLGARIDLAIGRTSIQ